MAVSWSAVKAGDKLYTRTRQKMGNTTMSQTVEHAVKILSIDHDAGEAIISWNGNPARKAYRSTIEGMFRNPMKRMDAR